MELDGELQLLHDPHMQQYAASTEVRLTNNIAVDTIRWSRIVAASEVWQCSGVAERTKAVPTFAAVR